MVTPMQMPQRRAATTTPAKPVTQRVPADAPHRLQAQKEAVGLVEALLAFVDSKASAHPNEEMLRMEAEEIRAGLDSKGPAAYNIGIVRPKSFAILLGMELGELISEANHYINKTHG